MSKGYINLITKRSSSGNIYGVKETFDSHLSSKRVTTHITTALDQNLNLTPKTILRDGYFCNPELGDITPLQIKHPYSQASDVVYWLDVHSVLSLAEGKFTSVRYKLYSVVNAYFDKQNVFKLQLTNQLNIKFNVDQLYIEQNQTYLEQITTLYNICICWKNFRNFTI